MTQPTRIHLFQGYGIEIVSTQFYCFYSKTNPTEFFKERLISLREPQVQNP
jgi:hypothetical protein